MQQLLERANHGIDDDKVGLFDQIRGPGSGLRTGNAQAGQIDSHVSISKMRQLEEDVVAV